MLATVLLVSVTGTGINTGGNGADGTGSGGGGGGLGGVMVVVPSAACGAAWPAVVNDHYRCLSL